jgi:V-type H+-transporting ATPase subunit a
MFILQSPYYFLNLTLRTLQSLVSVSHAASYLRLWALSLAHQQLSSVLFNYVLVSAMLKGGIATYIGFALWLGYSTYQFLCIGVLEVILHTMRLHWVEFMGTFYRGDGYLFEPFSFVTTLQHCRESG